MNGYEWRRRRRDGPLVPHGVRAGYHLPQMRRRVGHRCERSGQAGARDDGNRREGAHTGEGRIAAGDLALDVSGHAEQAGSGE
jgi:hypothetical protein